MNIKEYTDKLIGNEYILEGNVVSELIFNNYLKYRGCEYNKENNHFIVSSDFEKIVREEDKMLDNDFGSINNDYMIVPKCVDNNWMVCICYLKNNLSIRDCTFTQRSIAKNDKFIDCMKLLSGRE